MSPDTGSPDRNVQTAEAELIERLKSGHEDAFAELYDRYSALIHGIIARLVPNASDSENLLQDAFVKIWRSIHRYDPEKGRLATWLIYLARNIALDFLRSKAYIQQLNIQDIDSPVYSARADHTTLIPVDQIGIKQLVNQLPEEQRKMVEWLFFDGMTHQEVADEFGIPLGTVKSRARTALARLRDIFAATYFF